MGGYAGTGGGYAGAVRNGGRPPFDRNPTTWVPQAPMRSGKPNKINIFGQYREAKIFAKYLSYIKARALLCNIIDCAFLCSFRLRLGVLLAKLRSD